MINIKIKRPIIIVGKTGTGKTTKALEILVNNPIIRYANEYDIVDNFSIPIDRGILIEEAHYKPNVKGITQTILEYKGQIILTSLNQKDVPKKLFSLCKLKRAGTVNYLTDQVSKNALFNTAPINYDMNIFDLFHSYLKNSDREEVLLKLKMNKPSDVQMLSWLAINIHPNKIAYLDAKVKRKWSQDYFYELLAYAHNGKTGRVVIPSRRSYSKFPSICRRLGLKSDEERALLQLLQDDDFADYVKTKVNNVERRLLKLGEKPRKTKIVETQKSLSEWL